MIERTYAVPYAPATSPSFVRTALLGNIADCPQMPVSPFVASLGDSWGCTLCGSERPYAMPFLFGDVIPLQFNFVDRRNTTPSVPASGWLVTGGAPFFYVKAELWDDCGNTRIFEFVDEFCLDFWVDYSTAVGSVQTLFVDTGLLPLGTQAFRIKVMNYNLAGSVVETIWSEPFALINPACTKSVELIGQYATTDCLGHEYRTTSVALQTPVQPPTYVPTPFYLWQRLAAEMKYTGSSKDATQNDAGRVVSLISYENYNLIALQHIPPYAAKILQTIIQANTVLVNGVEYVNWGDLEQNTDLGRMFLPNLDAQTKCTINNTNCS